MEFRGRVAVALLLLWPVAARATTPVQKRAKDAGFPAENCSYCHSFDTDHMRERARSLGLQDNLDCMRCHGSELPKMGAKLYNARGLYLVGRKIKARAREVDVKWLRDYVEKDDQPRAVPEPRP
jgi:hypothetical protein